MLITLIVIALIILISSIKQVEEYERLKAKGGQKAAIAEVWRYKDPKKRETAKKNNLNYLEYWELADEEPFDPIERWKAHR